MFKIPSFLSWRRVNPVLVYRGASGAYDEKSLSDPCVVWDQDEGKWIMYYSAEGYLGKITAIAGNPSNLASYFEQWIKGKPLDLANRDILPDDRHYQKWWVLMDAYFHNKAVRIAGCFWAFFSSGGEIWLAKTTALTGTWTVELHPLLRERGLWLDSPSAFWFSKENKMVLYYTASSSSNHKAGTSLYASILTPDAKVEKAGLILWPSGQTGHWAESWLGGMDLFPSDPQKWMALVEAGGSRGTVSGFAICEQEIPISDWKFLETISPLEWPDQLPSEAREVGQEFGLGRSHLFCLPDGRRKMYYSSGKPGMEQIFYRVVQS